MHAYDSSEPLVNKRFDAGLVRKSRVGATASIACWTQVISPPLDQLSLWWVADVLSSDRDQVPALSALPAWDAAWMWAPCLSIRKDRRGASGQLGHSFPGAATLWLSSDLMTHKTPRVLQRDPRDCCEPHAERYRQPMKHFQ